MKKFFPRLSFLLFLSLLVTLAACSNLRPNSALEQTQASATDEDSGKAHKDSAADTKIKTADFAQGKDTLYDLLVAEIAAQRSQLGITLLNYLDQAQATRDLGVLKRAINAAQFVKDTEAVEQLALLWTEIDPNDPQPRQILAYQYAILKNYARSIEQIDHLIAMNADSRVEALAIGSLQLPDDDKNEILAQYQQLHARYPDNFDVSYSLAIVLRGLKRYDEAKPLLDMLIEKKPDFEPAHLLNANILFEMGDKAEAENAARKAFKKFPRNQSIGRLYASILIEQKKLEPAESVFEELAATFPDITALKLSQALVMLENGKEEAAQSILLNLRDSGLHLNESNYYLGRVAEKNQKFAEAIDYFSAVTSGPHFESALQHQAFLMIEQGRLSEVNERFNALRIHYPAQANLLWRIQFDMLRKAEKTPEALEILNQALDIFPDDNTLRYARAMIREQNADMTGMEEDLRNILTREPQNAIALNALGYTLADRNERLGEALLMIGTALSIDKKNPAILDSMGWVMFRLGKMQEALIFLVQAYDQNKDPEIASHLAEILFASDQPKQAKIVLVRAYRADPEHPILNQTIQRIAPDLLNEMQSPTSEINTDEDIKINLLPAGHNETETAPATDENQQ